MKIELIFTRKDGKKISIPFKKKELRDIYDLHYIVDPRDLKMNKIELNMNKMMFLIHDVMDEGGIYSSIGTRKMKNGKIKYYRWNKSIAYLVKKPKWR